MGFMVAQCGLGLFPIAVSHLVWHGLFKAYLFLASSSAAQEKRFDLDYPPSLSRFLWSLICGIGAWLTFAWYTHKPWLPHNSFLVLAFIVVISATQLALLVLRRITLTSVISAITLTLIAAAMYSASVNIITHAMASMSVLRPQPLNLWHYLGIFLLTISWLSLLFMRKPIHNSLLAHW